MESPKRSPGANLWLLPYFGTMDPEKHITEIEWLERIFAIPDTRPSSAADRDAANRRHDESIANSPWFKLWRAYGLPR
jgi:hypothetical protein